MRTKQEITAAILRVLPKDHLDSEYTVDELIGIWFMSKRTGSGLELTDSGDSAFRDADIEYTDRLVEYNTMSWVIYTTVTRKLRERIPCPWYLCRKPADDGTAHMYIRLYDTSFAMWIDLHGGLRSFLETNPLSIKDQ